MAATDPGVGLDTITVWCGATAAVAGALTLLWRIAHGLRRITQRVDEFVDDWHGVPERAGVPGRPGVMHRLGTIERQLDAVGHELAPNGGGSLRDAVDRVDQRTTPTH